MKFLVPLDGSELSSIVLPWVELLSSLPDSHIHLMRSHRPLEAVPMVSDLALVATELVSDSGVASRIEGELKECAKQLTGKVQVSSPVGHAAESILSSSEFADLIVIASHGESGLTRWFLGSITTKVVRASTKPVLVVTSRPDAPQRPAKLEKIMVPMDGSKTAEKALTEAARLARHFGARIVLYEAVIYREENREEDDWQVLLAQGYLREQAQKLVGVEVECLVEERTQGHGIVERAEQLDADMIVMGSHGRSGISRWVLGSVTENVVQRSSCPVMIVYDRD